MICKGSTVSIKTTNGGTAVVVLLDDYRPTYGVTVGRADGSYFFIPAWRLESVTQV